MKQYTTPEQTAKLIELGLPKPKTKVSFEVGNDELGYTYSIGELIEMLPPKIEAEMEDESNDEYARLSLEEGWDVLYRSGYYIVERIRHSKELIDALYDMIIMLKEEEVI